MKGGWFVVRGCQFRNQVNYRAQFVMLQVFFQNFGERGKISRLRNQWINYSEAVAVHVFLRIRFGTGRWIIYGI